MNFKSACIVTVGSEITRGLVQDTNSNWIANKLTSHGVLVKRIITVPDEKEEIKWALRSCLETAELVVTTGGLGFTHDDITVEAVADALGLKLVLSIEALNMIKSRVKGEVTYQVKAAYIPEGSRPLYNRVGISPGVHIVVGSKFIFLLPGVPGEMKAIFEDYVEPLVLQSGVYSKTIIVKTRHTYESQVDRLLEPLRSKYTWAYFKTHAKTPVEITVIVRANSLLELEERVNALIVDLQRTLEVQGVEAIF